MPLWQSDMNAINRKLLDAVIRRAEALCPDALSLIGVYGSAATGETHARSDLDLLILIRGERERGRALADAFILDDLGIGYDLYCTDWAMLERDAACEHPYIAKLMDAQIVYVGDEAELARLETLRGRAAAILSSDARFERADASLALTKEAMSDCLLSASLSDMRAHAANAIWHALNAVMLFHGRYFRKGVKRVFEEISALGLPFDPEELVMDIVRAETAEELCEALTALIRRVRAHLTRPGRKAEPTAEGLAGTYEEMFSNWRNKMWEAAERGDLYASYANLASFHGMLAEIAADTAIHDVDVMADFNPRDLRRNAEAFDEALRAYLNEYRRVGIEPRHFADADAYVASVTEV